MSGSGEESCPDLEAGTEPKREREGEGARLGKVVQAIMQSCEGLCHLDGNMTK